MRRQDKDPVKISLKKEAANRAERRKLESTERELFKALTAPDVCVKNVSPELLLQMIHVAFSNPVLYRVIQRLIDCNMKIIRNITLEMIQDQYHKILVKEVLDA